MKKLLPALIINVVCASSALSAFAQPALTPEQVVRRLFRGMERGDSATVHSAFSDDVSFATIFRNANNEAVIRRDDSIVDFLKAVGTPHNEVWYEENWDTRTQIDGDFAQVWCNYAFFLNDTFSHCGVDAFHLHLEKSGWKIFHLTDTRRKTGCEIPAYIREKHHDTETH